MLAEAPSADESLIAQAEALLTSHPDFGVTSLIRERASARLRFALQILGERAPGAGRAVAELDECGYLPHVLRDPVVRMATEAALQRLYHGQPESLAELEQVLVQARACAAPGEDRVPTQAAEGTGLVAGPDGGLWMPGFPGSGRPGAADLPDRLAQACTENFISRAGRTGELNPGTDHSAAQVSAACEVLAGVLPVLGPAVIGHVTAVGLITAQGSDGAMLSAAGGAPVPGIIVIRPSGLERPWDAAGRILHEALHLRLFDISMCSALIADVDAGAQVPWRPVRWDLRRIVAAFHVYAHLAVFEAATRSRQNRLVRRFGAPPANPGVSASENDDYAQPEQRLRFLGEQLTGPLAGNLTPTGRRFVRWQLDSIAPIVDWPAGPAQAVRSADFRQRPSARATHPAQGYRQAEGIVVRRDQQAGLLLAFNPGRGALHVINLAVWVAFELCDGRDLDAIRTSYADIVASKLSPADGRHLAAALTQLRDAGLIEPAGQPPAELPPAGLAEEGR